MKTKRELMKEFEKEAVVQDCMSFLYYDTWKRLPPDETESRIRQYLAFRLAEAQTKIIREVIEKIDKNTAPWED